MSFPRLSLATFLGLLALLSTSCGKSGGLFGPGGPINPGDEDAPQNLTYPQAVFVLSVGETLEAQVPTVEGEVDQYSLGGSLPAGLLFDPATGAISGSPSASAPPTIVQVSATNSHGSDQVNLSFSVPQVSNFAFASDSNTGSIVSFAVDRSCGSLVQASSIVASVTQLSSPLVDPGGRFLCVVNQLELLCFSIDLEDGLLTPFGDQVELGVGPHDLFLHPSAGVVYVTTQAENSLRAFKVDPMAGTINSKPISDLTTGDIPTRIIGDPNGRYLIVEHEFDDTPGSERTPLVCYTIAPGTGALTQSTTHNLAQVDPREMALDPLGESLYLTTSFPATAIDLVLHYSVDPSTGKPALVDLEGAGREPGPLLVDPRGNYLYVANLSSADITLMEIDPLTGSLQALASLDGSPAVSALSFASDGGHLYVVESEAQRITIQTTDTVSGEFNSSEVLRTAASSGVLALLATGGQPEPRAKDLFVLLDETGDVEGYRIASLTGALDSNGAPAMAGATPASLAVDPQGRFVYVAVRDSERGAPTNQVIVFGVQCDGGLTDLGTAEDLLAGIPGPMAIDPSGSFLYVSVSIFDLLIAYYIETDGALTLIGSRPLGENLVSIEIDPSGTYLALTHRTNDDDLLDRVVIHEIDPETGLLLVGVSTDIPQHPTAIAFDPKGTRTFVTMEDDDLETEDLAMTFDLAPDGVLTAVGTGAITQPAPRDIVLTPDGGFAFVAFEGSAPSLGGLLLYHVDPDTGELSNGNGLPQWRNSEFAGEGPARVEISPDGARLYVLARSSEQIFAFDVVDPLAGTLQLIESEMVGRLPIEMGMRVVQE